jgi:hypothetical protein
MDMKEGMKALFVVLTGLMMLAAGCSSNEAPVLAFNGDLPASVEAGDTVIIDVSASSDADGDELSYEFVLKDASGADVSELLTGRLLNVRTFTSWDSGSYELTVTVSDGSEEGAVSETRSIAVEGSKEFYLVGDLVGNWGAGDEANLMANRGAGVYEKLIEISAAGTANYQITTADWGIKFTGEDDIQVGETGALVGADLENKTITVPEAGIYRLSADLASATVLVEAPVYDAFYLVGDIVGNWDAGAAANEMTLVGDEVYEKTIEVGAAGTLSLQIATADWGRKFTPAANIAADASGSLVEAGMENMSIEVPAEGSYRIVADLRGGTIEVESLN